MFFFSPGPLGPICSAQTHLSVSALLWVSRAACRSFSSRLRAISSCSTSPWVHFRGLMKRISFSSSSFSLMRISRSLSESSTPGQASLSSLASWILRLAILGVEKVSMIDEQWCYRNWKIGGSSKDMKYQDPGCPQSRQLLFSFCSAPGLVQ